MGHSARGQRPRRAAPGAGMGRDTGDGDTGDGDAEGAGSRNGDTEGSGYGENTDTGVAPEPRRDLTLSPVPSHQPPDSEDGPILSCPPDSGFRIPDPRPREPFPAAPARPRSHLH